MAFSFFLNDGEGLKTSGEIFRMHNQKKTNGKYPVYVGELSIRRTVFEGVFSSFVKK